MSQNYKFFTIKFYIFFVFTEFYISPINELIFSYKFSLNVLIVIFVGLVTTPDLHLSFTESLNGIKYYK